MKSNIIRLRHIAGFCTEDAIWKMLVDLCAIIKGTKKTCFLTPDSILVDGDSFLIDETADSSSAFLPPEYQTGDVIDTPQRIWMLGAVIYYASSGKILFGGNGGSYQQRFPDVPIPALQKAHKTITPIMQQCLPSNPAQRMCLPELQAIAQREWELCQSRQRLQLHEQANTNNHAILSDERWPEEMKAS